MKRILNVVLATLLSLGCTNTDAQTIIPAEVPHSYDVSPNGSFSYSIPLRIPPGIKEMVPNLAITYNGSSSNDELGIGWSVSGVSMITKGLPTIYHNQLLAPIDFNSDDGLFLDGQRLFGVSGTNTYLSEIKNFADIQSHGTAGNGPSYFTVEYPNGMIYEYGNSSTSRMLAQGKTSALMWAVSKISDQFGNYITFNYNNSQSNGEYSISSISYGQNSVTNNGVVTTIQFNYSNKTDANTSYIAGSAVANNKRLDDITITFSNSSQANKYEFTYDSGVPSRLIKIQELRDGTEVMSPINISWGTYGATTEVLTNSTSTSNSVFSIGDFNGDGFSDYATTPSSGTGSNTITMYLNNKQNDFTQTSSTTINFVNPADVSTFHSGGEDNNGNMTLDWNGDGLDDMLVITTELNQQGYSARRIYLYTSTGTQLQFAGKIFEYSNNSHSQHPDAHIWFVQEMRILPGDFDGDQRTDLIVMVPNGIQSGGSGFVADGYDYFIAGVGYTGGQTSSGNWGTVYAGNWAHVGTLFKNVWDAKRLDFDGDGKDDLLITSDQVSGVQNYNGYEIFPIGVTYSGTSPVVTTIFGDPNTSYSYNPISLGTYPKNSSDLHIRVTDFNGDGKDDLLLWEFHSGSPNWGAWDIAYSNGATFTYYSPSVPSNMTLYDLGPNDPGNYNYFVSDFNGDGKSDVLQLHDVSGDANYDIYYSRGNNVFDKESGTLYDFAGNNSNNTSLGDFNGDGQPDLLCHNKWTNGNKQTIGLFRPNDNSRLISSINHVGKSITLQYELINKDVDYSASATALSYPYMSRTIPLKVVKNLSDNITMDFDYVYKGIVMHSQGLGLLGFEKFEIQNNIGQKTYQTYNLISGIPYMSESQVFDAYGALPYGTKTTYQQININGGASGRSRIIQHYASSEENNLTGALTETNIITGATGTNTVFYEYGQVESVEVLTKDLLGASTYSNNTTTYGYGTSWAANKGKPINVTVYSEKDPAGMNGITRVTNYTYNANGDVATETTDPATLNEKIKTFTYDPDYGNLTQVDVNATGIANPLVTEYTYTIDGRFMTSKSELVDPNANLSYVTLYDYGNTTQLQATWGNLLSTTDIKGNITYYEYDKLNRVTKTIDNTKGLETTTGYDWAINSMYSTSNPNQQFVTITTNNYNAVKSVIIIDKYGRKIRTIDTGPGGDPIKDFTYTVAGKLETYTNPYFVFGPTSKVTTTLAYDNYGRQVSKLTNNGGTQIYTTYSIINGLLNTTVTNQGANGRSKTYVKCGDYLKQIHNPTYTEDITYTYHGNGEKAVTISNGMPFENKVDNFGRIIEIIQPNAGTKEYTYDALDRVDIESLTNGIQYQYTYDNLGRIIAKQEVGTGAMPYVFEYGNTMNMADAGLIKSKEAPNGNKVEYNYNGSGELIATNEYNGIQNFIPGNLPFTVIYGRNMDGSISTITYLNDLTIMYDYNVWGGLKEVDLLSTLLPGTGMNTSPRKLWESWGYDGYGQLEGGYFFDPAGVQLYNVDFAFDDFGLPTSGFAYNNNFLGGPHIKDVTYDFDIHTGNLNSRTDNISGSFEQFDYDSYFDRLTKITGPNGIVDMSYDGNNSTGGSLGNVSMKTDVAVLPAPPNNVEWKHDGYALDVIPDPNAISTIPQFRQDVDYYNNQKIKSLEEELNNRIVFEYGADDQRVKVEYYDITGGSANPVLTQTKYYGNNYEYIIDPVNGDKHNIYIWAGKNLIGIIQGNSNSGTYTPSSANLYYTVTDYQGSITHILDDNGSGGALGVGLIEERNYDAWGRVRDPQTWTPYPTGGFTGNWIVDRGYTCHEHVWLGMYDNNVINMNGRLYDPLVAKMFSPDPLIGDPENSQAYNKYSYVLNNPLKYTDPSGNLFVGSVTSMFQELGATIFARGGLEFWNKSNSGNAWAEFRNSFSQPGGKVNNALRIDLGVFAWTDNKTVFGNLRSIVSRMTWESQQTELGKTVAHVRNAVGLVNNVDYYEGATIVNEVGSGFGWGSTMGSYIQSKNMTTDGYEDQLLRHEYGHYVQSQVMGPLYLSQVGVPSVIGGLLSEINGGSWHTHDFEWYETQANRLSNHYHRTGMRGAGAQYLTEGRPWNQTANPREYKVDAFWIFFHPINPFWLINVD